MRRDASGPQVLLFPRQLTGTSPHALEPQAATIFIDGIGVARDGSIFDVQSCSEIEPRSYFAGEIALSEIQILSLHSVK